MWVAIPHRWPKGSSQAFANRELGVTNLAVGQGDPHALGGPEDPFVECDRVGGTLDAQVALTRG